jgi:hypothetical protein
MTLTDLLGTLEISEQIRGGAEPAMTTTFHVGAAGFYDAGGIGRAGQEDAVLDVASVASTLTANFPAAPLRELLGHFVRLHEEVTRLAAVQTTE